MIILGDKDPSIGSSGSEGLKDSFMGFIWLLFSPMKIGSVADSEAKPIPILLARIGSSLEKRPPLKEDPLDYEFS